MGAGVQLLLDPRVRRFLGASLRSRENTCDRRSNLDPCEAPLALSRSSDRLERPVGSMFSRKF